MRGVRSVIEIGTIYTSTTVMTLPNCPIVKAICHFEGFCNVCYHYKIIRTSGPKLFGRCHTTPSLSNHHIGCASAVMAHGVSLIRDNGAKETHYHYHFYR